MKIIIEHYKAKRTIKDVKINIVLFWAWVWTGINQSLLVHGQESIGIQEKNTGQATVMLTIFNIWSVG